MRAHFDAVKTMLAPLGRAIYIIDVPETPSYPYIVLWGLPGLPEGVLDGSLQASQQVYDDLLRVTCAGKTPESAMEVRRLTRATLLGSRPTVAGRHIHELRLFDANNVDVDRDVTLPETGHPAYGTDIYRLVSEPIPAP